MRRKTRRTAIRNTTGSLARGLLMAVAMIALIGCTNVTLRDDMTGPYLTITSPSDYDYYRSSVTVDATVANSMSDASTSEVASVSWRIPDSSLLGTIPEADWSAGTFQFTFMTTTEPLFGIRFIIIKAEGKNNHITEEAITIIEYPIGPELSVTAPADLQSWEWGTPIPIQGSVQNATGDATTTEIDRVVYYIDGAGPTALWNDTGGSGIFSDTFDTVGYKGAKSLQIRAYDLNNHMSEVSIILLDNETGPYLEVGAFTGGPTAVPTEGDTYYYDTTITVTGVVRNQLDFESASGTTLSNVQSLSIMLVGPPAYVHEIQVPSDEIWEIDEGDGQYTSVFQHTIDTDPNVNSEFDTVRLTGVQVLKVIATDSGDRATEITVTMASDGVGPTFSGVSPADQTYFGDGDAITVAGTLDHPKSDSADIDPDTLTWNLFPSAKNGTFTINGSGVITSTPTIPPDPPDGVIDLTGENDTRTLTLSASDWNGDTTEYEITLLYDGAEPTVDYVTATNLDGLYSLNDTITVQVVFDRDIQVTADIPTLVLQLDAGTRLVNCDDVTPAVPNILEFTYTIQNGDRSSDLDYASMASLSGNIYDVFANKADLTLVMPGLSGSLGEAKDLTVDGDGPDVSSVVTADTDYNGFIDRLIVTFDENVDEGTIDDGGFMVDNVAETVVTDGEIQNAIVFVDIDEYYDTGRTPNLDLDAAAIEDLAGNANVDDDYNPSTDGAGPVIKNVQIRDDDSDGYIDRLRVTFSEDVDYPPDGEPDNFAVTLPAGTVISIDDDDFDQDLDVYIIDGVIDGGQTPTLTLAADSIEDTSSDEVRNPFTSMVVVE